MWRMKILFRALLALLVIAVAFPGASLAFAQGAAAVRVDPAVLTAQVNDNFDVFVRADNVSGLTAFEIHLSFDPAVLELVEMNNGGFVVADFTVQNTFDNLAGTIDYAIAQLNRTPALGSGALLKITFRAKANGTASLALRSVQAAPTGMLLADSNGASIQAAWIGGSVTVGNGTGVTPVPTTVTASPTQAVTASATTPSPTPTTSTTPVVTPANGVLGTHTVRWGETLYCLGRAYGVWPWSIAETNRIWWPYFIFPGQVLTIPNSAWEKIPAGPVCQRQFTATVVVTPVVTVTPSPTSSTPTATPSLVPPPACRAYHVVRSGETLYSIGIAYGVPYMEIARVNQLANPRLIYAGQRLCIP